MTEPAPITVGIPTYARGEKVFQPLRCLQACVPPPAEIIVHVDADDGGLAAKLACEFPSVRVLSSPRRVGPGGGRHRCIQAASHEIFASFDDDSWPADSDYFARLMKHVESMPDVACFAAVIAQKNEVMPSARNLTTRAADFTGCGYALRSPVYRSLPGFVDRPTAYGLEERDLALQLHAAGGRIACCHDLRVFHDTDFSHHGGAEIVAATLENAALLAWLRYPISLWSYGMLQFANVIWFMLRKGRIRGIAAGVLGTPASLWRYRRQRHPLDSRGIRSYLKARKAALAASSV